MVGRKRSAEVLLSQQELHTRAVAKKVTVYKKIAAEFAKRAVNAEQKLYQLMGE